MRLGKGVIFGTNSVVTCSTCKKRIDIVANLTFESRPELGEEFAFLDCPECGTLYECEGMWKVKRATKWKGLVITT